jgi:hypothetical protein
MPRDGEHGDAMIFSTDWPAQDWDRHKSWYDAWQWLGGSANSGDAIEVLDPGNSGDPGHTGATGTAGQPG